jgi:adenosylcobinamide-phosphate synthase
MSIALGMLLAVALDAWLGEPRRAHPLVAFGRLAGWIEKFLYANRVSAGALAWALAVLPPLLLVSIALQMLKLYAPWLAQAAGALLLYATLGLRSLGQHAQPVAAALHAGDLDAARAAVGRMVSRDTASLDQSQIAAATTESVLENGNDAVFGALFWFVLLGAPGAVLYRLANTLDAMWGYRNTRYERFGKFAARIDDVLNYLPARLTACSYALCGDARRAWRCWRRQASGWDSPNAGPVMAAGAGALGVRLGGPASYHGVWEDRPILGEGVVADTQSIERALRLVRRAVVLWLVLAGTLALTQELFAHA